MRYIGLRVSREIEIHDLTEGSFRVGDWLVEPSLNRVSRRHKSVQLEIKMMDVLVCLAQHAGELVERRQIVDSVWATEYLSDNTLTHAIAELRNALGDDVKHPAYIDTIYRRGYRLIAPVEGLTPAAAQESVEEPACKLVVGERECFLREGENLIGRAREAYVCVNS